jgi:hypothetical protein
MGDRWFAFEALLGYEKLPEQPFTKTRTKLPCHFVVMTKSLMSDPPDPPDPSHLLQP